MLMLGFFCHSRAGGNPDPDFLLDPCAHEDDSWSIVDGKNSYAILEQGSVRVLFKEEVYCCLGHESRLPSDTFPGFSGLVRPALLPLSLVF